MNALLAELNNAQQEAVQAPDGPVLVVAGAGSGKTRALTTRIAWLLREGAVPPGAVIAFTFTNKAAREVRERVDRLVGAHLAPSWIGTFHATGVKILRRDGGRLGIDHGFSIYDTDDTQRMIKRVMQDVGVDPQQITPAVARSLISRWKNGDLDAAAARASTQSYIEQKCAVIYEFYEKALRTSNALDFDDLILRTVHLLEQVPEVQEKYARKFRHVLVDEFQDTNALQLVLVKALCSYHGNVFVVGDDDQSIYAWRGACIENMLRFEEYFPGTRVLRLEQNYRSTGNILAAANAVIAHNRFRKGKNLWTTAAAGDPLWLEGAADAEDEAARVVSLVERELEGGLSRREVTVLYRTNAQSRLLEAALRRAALPYQIVGSTQFYERREVRDVLAYLKLVANARDTVSALRVLNVPKRRIGEATAGRLAELARTAGLTLGEAALRPGVLESALPLAARQRVRAFFAMVTGWRAAEPETTVPALLERIIDETGYLAHLQADEPATARDRQANIAELVNAAHDFHEASDGGRLAQFLEQVALVSDVDGLDEEQGTVRLMTIHTAKGLEFPVVILVGCEEDLLPHVSSLDDQQSEEEERRLFYVALTRARRRIYLLHASRRRRFGTYEDTLPSRFLGEIPAELVTRVPTAPALGDAAWGAASGAPRGASGGAAWGSPPRTWPGSGTASRGWTGPTGWMADGRTRRPGLYRKGDDRLDGRAEGHPPGSSPGAHPGAIRGTPPAEQSSVWTHELSQEEVHFHIGQTVIHPSFGQGTVVRLEGSGENLQVSVDFPEVGRKHLLARLAHIRPVE